MLPSKRLLTELIGSVYDAAGDAAFWEVFLGKLGRITRASSAALVMHDIGRKQHSVVAGWRIDPDGARLYKDYYGPIDIWANRAEPKPAGYVCTSESLCPQAELTNTEFYNDFLAHQHISHGLFGAVENSTTRWATVSLYRDVSRGEFQENPDLRTLKLLVPHVRRVFTLHCQFTELKIRAEGIEKALNMLATGLVFVGGTRQVVLMNSRAEDLLRERDGLLMVGRELTAGLSQESKRLRAIIDSAVNTANGKGLGPGGTLLVSRQKGRPLSISVVPLRSTALPLPKAPAAVLFISDPDQNVELPADVLGRCYGLTGAEARLTTVLLEGYSLKETADLCRVTYNTAKSQLKSIFSKTQVGRQTELVKLLVSQSSQIKAADVTTKAMSEPS